MAHAPPQLVAGPSPALEPASELQVMLGTLRQLRAAAQYVDGALTVVADAVARTSTAERRAALDQVANEGPGPLSDGIASGGDYLSQAKIALEASPYLRDWLGDEHARIELLWEEVIRRVTTVTTELAKRSAKPQTAVPESMAIAVASGRAALREVIVSAASITIPARLDQFLDETSVGRNLSFKRMFEDELPDEKDRAEVLRRISESAAGLHGVVDLDTMSVLAISSKPSRRRLSYRLEAAALLLGGLIAFLVAAALRADLSLGKDGLHANAGALSSLGALLIVYAGGAGFHFVVDLIKAQQGALGSATWAALDDWLLWMHARELKVISSCIALWIAFAALILLYPGTPDALTGFLAGYSFDSLADVVIKRFDALAGAKLGPLKETLGATA